MHLCLCAVRIVDRRQLRCICYYGDYEEGYDVDFGCPQATEQQKTITDHSRNVIVILYIVFILNMVNILKVCTCNQKFIFAHILLAAVLYVCLYWLLFTDCKKLYWLDRLYFLYFNTKKKHKKWRAICQRKMTSPLKKNKNIGELHAFEVCQKITSTMLTYFASLFNI